MINEERDIMPRKNCSKFNFAHRRETLLALAISAALAPASAWALNLQEAPPQVVPPYVAPNVIISLDDTGSMGSTDMKDPVSGAYISRLTALKNAVKSVFQDKDLLPDGKIRLAWQSIWIGTYGGSEALKKAGSFGPNQLNSMAPLEGAHRTDFIAFINALATSGNTSLHKLVSQADGYMRGSLNTNSPWASKDASGKTVYLGCRRNYHILMTDGRWNNAQSTPSNSDDSIFSFAAPDGSTKAFPAPVGAGRNVYTDSSAGTLADWAFYSWAKPLQNATDLTGKPQVDPAYTAAPATSTFGAASMDKFWDPRYDPATWPHMVTYTIGFSSDATTWSNTATGGPAMTAPSQNVPYSYDGSFPDLVTGTKNWPSMGGVGDETVHALDLWHASVNGRGRFYAVNSAADLEAAFRQIIGTINADNQPVTGNGTTSGSNSSRVDVGRYLTAYQSAEHWKGYVQAFKITSSTSGTTVTDIKTPLWTTSNKLDARSPDSRVILTWDDALAQGKNFDWTLLNATERAALNQNYSTSPAGTDTLGKDRVAYIRGDRSKEGSGTATAPFRVRASAQGDIVNSILWYTDSVPASGYALKDYSTFAQDQITLKRPSMLYVGGNDGMLHGFRAYGLNADGSPDYDTGGDELFAYVPHGVIDN
ncbi:MAG: hypothetical protein LBV44_03860, partial [Methylobacillus sp.]|nr:hypothetical protein [Methylobacillus sp.]